MQQLCLKALSEDFSGCSLETAPIPSPRPGQALIKVYAAAIGFPDLLTARGRYQHKPDLPFVLGCEAAGEVVALGEGARGYDIGAPVVALSRGGAFAEYAAYDVACLRAKARELSFEVAAALPSAYVTAYVALVRSARIRPGEWLLVHGASGGVGLAAVDLGKALGARVIAASSSQEKLSVLERIAAPDALLHAAPGFHRRVNEITSGAGVDVVFDPVGGDTFDESLRCVAFGGRLLVVGFASGRIPELRTNIALLKGVSVIGVRAGEYGRRFPAQGRENLDEVLRLAQQESIQPHVHACLPLASWLEAFALMDGRKLIGRVLLRPGQDGT